MINLCDHLRRITFFEEGTSELGKLADVVQALGSATDTIEIAADGNVIDADLFHNMFDVVDDILKRGARGVGTVLGHEGLELFDGCGLILAGHDPISLGDNYRVIHRAGIPGFLVQEIAGKIDTHDTVSFGERLDHVIGHVARGVAEGATTRMAGD